VPTKIAKNDPLLTDTEVAARLQVCKKTVSRLRYADELPTVRVGNRARIPASSVDEYIRRQLEG